MLDWLRKRISFAASVLFRGSLPPRAEDFTHLARQQVSVTTGTPSPRWRWALSLCHPEWGTATLSCLWEQIRVSRADVDYAVGLTPEEKETVLLGESSVNLTVGHADSNLLRDRKRALRFLRAIMGTDGLAGVDHLAQRFWSREALDDELCHDADLDIEQIYTLHAVGEETAGQVDWLHSHGLSETGFFDFDILRPSPDFCEAAADGLRAIAFAIVEGSVGLCTPRFQLAPPGGWVRFVKAADFNRYADPADTRFRQADEGHQASRAVLCEPAGRLLGRWSRRIERSEFLSRPLSDETVFSFSREASELMAKRARDTYSLFRSLREELAEFGFPAMVKLGYRVDGGGENDQEHLWFTVHELSDAEVDATLENQPLGIARLKAGDRNRHPVDLLSDWMILTPAGEIHPRYMGPIRQIRAHREELRKLMSSQPS